MHTHDATIEHGALRTRRVTELRDRVGRGEYRVDANRVATAIVARLAACREPEAAAAGPPPGRRAA